MQDISSTLTSNVLEKQNPFSAFEQFQTFIVLLLKNSVYLYLEQCVKLVQYY